MPNGHRHVFERFLVTGAPRQLLGNFGRPFTAEFLATPPLALGGAQRVSVGPWMRERGAAPLDRTIDVQLGGLRRLLGWSNARDRRNKRLRTACSYLASNFRASAGVAGTSPSSSMILTAFSTNAALLGASRPLPR